MSPPSIRRLLDEVAAMRIELHVENGALRYRPGDLMPPALFVRLKRHKAEVVATLQGGETFTGQVLDLFEGEVAASTESCSLDPAADAPGTPPTRACNGCMGRAFHKVRGGPNWVCDRCHPGPGPEGWIERAQATEPSIFDSMHGRGGQA